MQDGNVGYQVQEDPGNGYQNHSSAGPDVQSNGCDEGLVNGFEDPGTLFSAVARFYNGHFLACFDVVSQHFLFPVEPIC